MIVEFGSQRQYKVRLSVFGAVLTPSILDGTYRPPGSTSTTYDTFDGSGGSCVVGGAAGGDAVGSGYGSKAVGILYGRFYVEVVNGSGKANKASSLASAQARGQSLAASGGVASLQPLLDSVKGLQGG
jgi:hypothetical protein